MWTGINEIFAWTIFNRQLLNFISHQRKGGIHANRYDMGTFGNFLVRRIPN
jgi:hypothetical protein